MQSPAVQHSHCAPLLRGFVVLACLTATGTAQTVYVDDDAAGANDGSSWCDAYRSLQDALAAAEARGIPTIRVAQGTYHPDRGSGRTALDRGASFQLVPGTLIEGGYAGCGAADPDLRDPEQFVTTLSGDLLGNDAGIGDNGACPCFAPGGAAACTPACIDAVSAGADCSTEWSWQEGGTPGCAQRAADLCCADCPSTAPLCDNSWHVVVASGIPTAFTSVTGVDGCTIRGGYANGAGANTGGGLLCLNASPTVSDCRFVDNRAVDDGGAARIAANSLPWFSDCRFDHNTAGDDGGGVKITDSAPVFHACVFAANRAGAFNPAGDGGAALNGVASTAEFNDCQFDDNSAPDDGGAVYNEGSIEPDQHTRLTLRGASFQRNSAGTRGGAVHGAGNTDALLEGAVLFTDNAAPAGPDWALRSGTTRIALPRSSAGAGPAPATEINGGDFEITVDDDSTTPDDGDLGLAAGTSAVIDRLIVHEEALNETARPAVVVDGMLVIKQLLSVGGDPGDCTPSDFCTRAFADVRVLGDMLFSGNASIDITSAVALTLQGDLVNETSSALAPQFFNWSGPLRMTGTAAQQVHVAGADLGPVAYVEATDNFGIRTLEIAGGSDVALTPAAHPLDPTGCPALYVETLTLEPGATLRFDDVVVYADAVVDLGGEMCFSGACGELVAPELNTCQLFDINRDCTIRLTDDLREIIDCMFRDDCNCIDGTCVCAIDCNCDGALTVVGDGRCLVECFESGTCPPCADRVSAGARLLAVGGIVARDDTLPLLSGIRGLRVQVTEVRGQRSGSAPRQWTTTTDDLGIWTVPKLAPGTYRIAVRAGLRTWHLEVDLTAENHRRLQNILTVFPEQRRRTE